MSPPVIVPMSLVGLVLCAAVFAAQTDEPTIVRPKHPKVADRDWPRIPLDHFVLAKLEAKGEKPPAEADKTTCLRRASLDLTGEPPTADELAAIAADKSPNAYDKAIERLLASPRCAEGMTKRWLELVGDDDADDRAWVVKAYAADMPYDRFIVEQSTRSPRVRPRVLDVAGITARTGEPVRDAVDRQRTTLARAAAERCWRTLMKTDAAIDPEMLDWLACELMQSTQISCCRLEDPLPEPWALKPFLRTIVTCAAYRCR
jgi:Protein of unknown function (DUF1549)